jgi:hypothetical protein
VEKEYLVEQEDLEDQVEVVVAINLNLEVVVTHLLPPLH